MKIKEIQDLINFISESGLNEVNIETEDIKLMIRKDAEVKQTIVESSAPVAVPAPAAPAAAPAPAPAASVASAEPAGDDAVPSNAVEIKSPMIGTFYRSANPDAPPFIKVGDKVTKGQTVCIVEAMKLFNEIESEVSGTVIKVVTEDASPVEYDQPLFLVDPS